MLCAFQDLKLINTPTKVKKYLDTEGVEYDAQLPPSTLRLKAKARMKRKLDETTSVEAQRDLFQEAPLKTVTDLIEMMEVVKSNKTKCFMRVKFNITSISPDVVRLKHAEEHNAPCRGIITAGKCNFCQTYVPGVVCYSFMLMINDVDHDEVVCKTIAAKVLGTSIFQMSAEAFSNLSSQARADVIESAMTRTYRAGTHIHPDDKTGGAICALQAAVAVPDL